MTASGHQRLRTAVSILVVAALLLGVAPATALAADAGIALSATRTDEQVRQMWTQLKPTYSGTPYAVAPGVKAPYAPGAVNPGFLVDGLGIINFARFLAGVPNDVTLDATLNETSQYGAVLLAASTFGHTPPKPEGMSDAFYSRALTSTTQSNIGLGLTTSEGFQLGCLADKDTGNIGALGHRRWLMNPQMLKTGMGYAESRHTTFAFDRSRADKVTYAAIAYPSAGAFPVDAGFFDASTPWSITLNPGRYDWDGSGHTVTLKRVADGKTWTFTAADTNTGGEFFSFNTAGYGVPNAFIFRPAPTSVGAYNEGDEFDVTLFGGIYAEGTRTPATVSYRTRFISLADDGLEPTSLTASVSSAITHYGAAATVSGELRTSMGEPLPDVAVTVEVSTDLRSWTPVGAFTSETGSYLLNVAPTRTTYYRARFAGDPAHRASVSAVVSIAPKVWMTTPTAPSAVTRGVPFTSSGYLRPKHTAGTYPVKIEAWKYQSGVWVRKLAVSARAYNATATMTRYAASIRLSERGSWRIRAVHAADAANARTYAGWRYVTVR